MVSSIIPYGFLRHPYCLLFYPTAASLLTGTPLVWGLLTHPHRLLFFGGNKRPNFVLCLTSYMDAGNLNLSLHVCMASTLPSKPAPYFSSPAHFLEGQNSLWFDSNMLFFDPATISHSKVLEISLSIGYAG